jgi:hypothetical protein
MTTTSGYVSSRRAGPQVSRGHFLEDMFFKGFLCAWWFTDLEESPATTESDYKFLNVSFLIANHHEFLFDFRPGSGAGAPQSAVATSDRKPVPAYV